MLRLLQIVRARLHTLGWKFGRPRKKMLSRQTRKAYANSDSPLCIMAETWYWEQVWLQTVVPTVALLLCQYPLRCLIWESRVKNIQCGHTILILARKLNQLLPFENWQRMVSLSHMLPAAAFSLRFHFSVSIVSLVLAFYDPNSDGCIPVWNDLAGCECGPSFASHCCHLVSGRKSTGTIRGDMRKLVCWQRTSLI